MRKRQCWNCERSQPTKKVVFYEGVENYQGSAFVAICRDTSACRRAGNKNFARSLRKQPNRLQSWSDWLECYRYGAGVDAKYDRILSDTRWGP